MRRRNKFSSSFDLTNWGINSDGDMTDWEEKGQSTDQTDGGRTQRRDKDRLDMKNGTEMKANKNQN